MRSVRSACLTHEAGLACRMRPWSESNSCRIAAKCFFEVGFEALKDRDLANCQQKYHGVNDLS